MSKVAFKLYIYCSGAFNAALEIMVVLPNGLKQVRYTGMYVQKVEQKREWRRRDELDP